MNPGQGLVHQHGNQRGCGVPVCPPGVPVCPPGVPVCPLGVHVVLFCFPLTSWFICLDFSMLTVYLSNFHLPPSLTVSLSVAPPLCSSRSSSLCSSSSLLLFLLLLWICVCDFASSPAAAEAIGTDAVG